MIFVFVVGERGNRDIRGLGRWREGEDGGGEDKCVAKGLLGGYCCVFVGDGIGCDLVCFDVGWINVLEVVLVKIL